MFVIGVYSFYRNFLQMWYIGKQYIYKSPWCLVNTILFSSLLFFVGLDSYIIYKQESE